MKDLIQWTPQTSVKKMASDTKAILATEDLEVVVNFRRYLAIHERSADVFNKKAQVKAIQQHMKTSERRMGELLKVRETAKTRGKGGKYQPRSSSSTLVGKSLEDLGITKDESSDYQKMADVAVEIFDEMNEKNASRASIIKTLAPKKVSPVIATDKSTDGEPLKLSPETIETFAALLKLDRDGVITESTIRLFLCYCVYGSTSPIQKEITGYTKLQSGTIKNHNKILDILNAVKREKKGIHTEVQVIKIPTPTPSSSIKLIKTIINLESRENYANKQYNNSRTSTREEKNDSGFTLEDIKTDEHYLKARVSLDKYFDDFEIDPAVLLTKKRMGILTELMQDNAFDFEGYCKWYHKDKCPDPGFGFGLFLYPNIIKEYQTVGKRKDKYLKTSPKVESESRKQGLKETDAFLKEVSKQVAKDKEKEKKEK